jgi:hypothetical protein
MPLLTTLAARIRFCVCAILLLAHAVPLAAQSIPLGVGNASCGAWAEARESRETTAVNTMTAWVQGFLAGSALALTQLPTFTAYLLHVPDAATIHGYIDTHCRTHPLDKMMHAAFGLHGDIQLRLKQ